MKDSPVAGLNRLISRGGILFVEGKDLRTPEAGIEWQGRATQFFEEAEAWVKEQSPDDDGRLEILSPYPPVDLPLGNPWWTPTLALSTASCTSSVLCEENHPVSYHLALINRLEEIVSDWRVNPPGRKTGRRLKNMNKQISTAKDLAKDLQNIGGDMSKLDAATQAVQKLGKGDSASEAAAIQYVRKKM